MNFCLLLPLFMELKKTQHRTDERGGVATMTPQVFENWGNSIFEATNSGQKTNIEMLKIHVEHN